MANAVVSKLLGMFGMGGESAEQIDDFDEELMDDNYDQDPVEEEDNKFWNKKNSKVLTMPQVKDQNSQVRMVIKRPTEYNDVGEIISLLKNRQSVIINLEYVNKDIQRRMVDTIWGAVTALDGKYQKISNSICLIAPFNYEVSNDMPKEDKPNKNANLNSAPWFEEN